MHLALKTIAALSVVFLWEHPVWAAGAPPKRPNILLILADDMGYSDLGCYGSEIHTPNLDALAAEGLRFTQFYNGARCCPSRASLLTGLYAQQTGLGGMTGNEHLPGYEGRINKSCVTLAEVLKGAGYQTFMSGKWHVGDMVPTTRGFDRFYGFYTGYTTNSWNPNQMGLFPPGKTHSYAPGKFYATDAITDYALDFINQGRQNADRPWFLYLAYQAAHFPLMAPKKEVDPYVPVYKQGWDRIRDARLERIKQLGILSGSTVLSPRSLIPKPQLAARDGLNATVNPAWDSLEPDRQEDLAHRMAIYAAMVEHMDRDIGHVIEDLRAHHELDNTLILFLSDNGACAEWAPYGFDLKMHYPAGDGTKGNGHGYDGNTNLGSILHTDADLETMGQLGGPGVGYGSGWANACNTPFRMYKHYNHEGGISTPLIVHWPAGIVGKGGFRTQVGHVIDIMTTLVEVSGATYPTEFDGNAILPMEGTSLTPAFVGQPMTRGALFWEHENNRAVRMGNLKLVSLTGHPWELYDMVKDRTELHDLSAEMPGEVRKMAASWDAWAARCHVIKPKKEKANDDASAGKTVGD
jgi:arylsulfatase